VKWLHSVVAVVLLALWLPATRCCTLEGAGVSGFADCCIDEGTDSQPEQPCDGDTCCQLEKGIYKLEQVSIGISAPEISVPGDLVNALMADHDVSIASAPSSSPPDLPVSWQFSYRAALPARAPSIAS
jgi:hypothetical protein